MMVIWMRDMMIDIIMRMITKRITTMRRRKMKMLVIFGLIQ